MSRTMTATVALAHPFFAMICVILLCFLLPRVGTLAVMVGSAGVLSAYVAVMPARFRSKGGSMLLAHGLVAGMWLAAAVVAALTLMGQIKG